MRALPRTLSALVVVGGGLLVIAGILALVIPPFVYEASTAQLVASFICGLGLIALSYRRGAILQRYGSWQGWIV